MARNKKLKEVGAATQFSSTNQPSEESKSRGQIERAKNKNILYTARTLFENANILPQMVQNIKEEVESGINKNAIDFFKAIKEPEEQNINLNGGVEVQKVYVDAATKQKYQKHIDDFINGK